jgi:hypothetical protein
MTAASSASINADEIIDVALHYDLKCRAYELYDQHCDPVLRDEFKLQTELPRVAYALSQMQKYHDGNTGDTRAVRAARVYLRALISFVRQA